jgi:hypothetical protein
MDKLLYTRKETAALLSISVRRLDYLIEQSVFKPCRIGRKVTIPAKQITKFAAGDWPELAHAPTSESADIGLRRVR